MPPSCAVRPPASRRYVQRLVPRLALLRVAREHVELLRVAQRRQDAEVELAPALVQQRLVGHRLRERVLELVGELLAIGALDEKPRALEPAQRLAQLVGRRCRRRARAARRSPTSPTAAMVCSTCLSVRVRRSMRAASTARTVGGIVTASRRAPSR